MISDNGIGLDTVKNKDNLFKLYKRFHSHVEGKGIGLYLVKTQLEVLGGKIEMISKKGNGALFRIYFKSSEKRLAKI